MARAVDVRLVEMWQGRKKAAHEYRQHFEQRWYDNWQWYRNAKSTTPLPGQFWRSNRQLPDAFRVIETMLPQHVMGMFRSPQWFSVEAPSTAGKTYQLMAKQLLKGGWRRAEGFRKTIEGLKYCHIMGHMVSKTVWEIQLGEREVLDLATEFDPTGTEVLDARFVRKTVPDVRFNGPQIHMPSLFNLWQDPSGREQWWIEKIPASLEQLQDENKRFDGQLYNGAALSRLAAGIPVAGKREGGGTRAHRFVNSFDPWSSQDVGEVIEGIPESIQRDPDHIELWQCWGWVPPSVRDYSNTERPTQWRLMVLANGEELLRDVPAPTPNHLPPYNNVPAIPIPHQIFGDSVLSYIGPLIDLRSFIENARRDEVLLNMFGTYIMDGNIRADNTQFKMPGGVAKVYLDPGQRLQDVIQPQPRQPILPDAYRESGIKEQQMLAASGATEPFQGQAFGARTTATEVGLIAEAGMGRFQLATMWADEAFKKPTLEQMFKLYQTRLTTPQAIELAGNPQVRGEITLQDLAYDVDIYVDSGKLGSMDQQKLNSMVQLFQAAMGTPDSAIWVDPAAFVQNMAFRLGVEESDGILRTPEQVQQIQQQQQAAAQQQQQFELQRELAIIAAKNEASGSRA